MCGGGGVGWGGWGGERGVGIEDSGGGGEVGEVAFSGPGG